RDQAVGPRARAGGRGATDRPTAPTRRRDGREDRGWPRRERRHRGDARGRPPAPPRGGMSLDDQIRDVLLGAAPELAARLREELGGPRRIPLAEAPVARRTVLDAERAGELSIYRTGQARLLDESELYAWIRRTGAPRRAPAEPADEVGELIAIGDERRRRR